MGAHVLRTHAYCPCVGCAQGAHAKRACRKIVWPKYEHPHEPSALSDAHFVTQPRRTNAGIFIVLDATYVNEPCLDACRRFQEKNAPRQTALAVTPPTPVATSPTTPEIVRNLSENQRLEYKRLKEALRRRQAGGATVTTATPASPQVRQPRAPSCFAASKSRFWPGVARTRDFSGDTCVWRI